MSTAEDLPDRRLVQLHDKLIRLRAVVASLEADSSKENVARVRAAGAHELGAALWLIAEMTGLPSGAPTVRLPSAPRDSDQPELF